MAKIIIKPRWDVWENLCLVQAHNEKIQLKVIALALGRTVTSVSKKVKQLGLRALSQTPGRIKGKKNDASWNIKNMQDLKRMKDIFAVHAPMSVTQKAELPLNTCPSNLAIPFEESDATERVDSICHYNWPYSCSVPLEYILSHDHISPSEKGKKVFGDPYYVSFYDVERWAVSQGFRQMKETLKEEGATFWKDGKYFSKAQLLIYINQIRLGLKLQPLAVEEEM
jgi:hypothetical protein